MIVNDKPVLCVRERCGCDGGGKGLLIQKDKSGTLAVSNDQMVVYGFPLGFRPENVRMYQEKSSTVCNGSRPGFCNGVVAIDRAAFNQGENEQYDFEISESGVNSTLTAKGASVVSYSIGNGQANNLQLNAVGETLNCMHDPQAIVEGGCIVRRLTPLECERLQGFPDGWTDIGEWTDSKGKKSKASDTARYKALGNSIALPFWAWMLERLNGYCEDHTMASLFDGIGGFPLIWETINGKGSCLWASEIEEFPIAVTKYHFGG